MTIQIPKTRPPATHLPAARLETFLRGCGHGDVPCVDVPKPPPGVCTGCAARGQHDAFCVVNVARESGAVWADALCLIGLPTYLTVIKDDERFEGASIEVHQPASTP